jgi:uncharacterized protein YegL
MSAEFTPRVDDSNPDPRIACALLLDTSSSMSGNPIQQLNAGFEQFCDEIRNDDLACKRAEISVITFDSSARVDIPFTEGRYLQARHLTASGSTAMGAAINLALDELAAQKSAYKNAGLEYYRPWLFVLTDGAPTDGAVFNAAATRAKEVEAARGVTVFPIGVGPNADLIRLKELSARREPVRLDGLKFKEFFHWLSASLSAASQSGAHGSNDTDIAGKGTTEQIALPSPSGWAVAD